MGVNEKKLIIENYRSEIEEIFISKKTYIGGIGGTSSLIGIGFNLLPKGQSTGHDQHVVNIRNDKCKERMQTRIITI